MKRKTFHTTDILDLLEDDTPTAENHSELENSRDSHLNGQFHSWLKSETFVCSKTIVYHVYKQVMTLLMCNHFLLFSKNI